MPLYYAFVGLRKFTKFKKTNLHKKFHAKKIRISSDADQMQSESSRDTPAKVCQLDRGAFYTAEILRESQFPEEKTTPEQQVRSRTSP